MPDAELVQHQEINYDVTLERIETAAVTYADLEAESREGYELVRIAIRDCREMRGKIERRRKELKRDALEWGRAVDAAAKELKSRIVEIEEPLKAKKGVIDDAKAAAKAERERLKREAIEAELRAQREAEEAAAAARLAEEERQRQEAERIASEAVERAEAAEAALRAEKERQAAEKRERAAAAEADERARREAEAVARAAAEREAELRAMAPDAEKLAIFADELLAVEAPVMDTPDGERALDQASRTLETVVDFLRAPALAIKELP